MLRQTVTLPKLGETVDEVVVVEWLIEIGEHVEAEQTVLVVETDKIETEVPAPFDGVLTERLVEPEQEVATGEPIFVLETSDGEA